MGPRCSEEWRGFRLSGSGHLPEGVAGALHCSTFPLTGTAPTNAWQTMTYSAVAPTGTTQVRVRVMYSTINWAQSGGLVDGLSLQDEQAVGTTPAAWGQVKALYR